MGDQTKTELAEEFKAKAEKRKEAIQKYMWSEEGFYLDYDFEDEQIHARMDAGGRLSPLF